MIMVNNQNPCLVMVAPNGARRTKEDHPALPITPDEIATDAAKCFEAGAGLLHLHVRDNNQRHLLDAGAYAEATKAVRDAVGNDMIIQVTTEAAGIYQPDQQMQVVRELHPEAVSVAVRELVPDPASEAKAGEFFQWLANEEILAQYILYSPDEVRAFNRLQKTGSIPDQGVSVLFVLGRYAGADSNPDDLQDYVDALNDHTNDHNLSWAVCGFGPLEADLCERAIALGGHTRVGFENNLHTQDGLLADDNAALVYQVVETLKKLNRPLANPAEARKLLAGKGDYQINNRETVNGVSTVPKGRVAS